MGGCTGGGVVSLDENVGDMPDGYAGCVVEKKVWCCLKL